MWRKRAMTPTPFPQTMPVAHRLHGTGAAGAGGHSGAHQNTHTGKAEMNMAETVHINQDERSRAPSAERPRRPRTSAGTGTRRWAGCRRVAGAVTAVAVVATLIAVAPSRPADAAVSGITSGGSILYSKDRNLWLASPDGATQRQVTTDGGTETADFTGSEGYTSPSQSDAGDVLVAVRNEGRTGDLFRLDGYLWVMNRQGQVIRKFMPPQGVRWGQTICSDSVVVAPRGIIDASVSPDGTKIAYVSQWNFHYCDRVVEHTQAWVVNIDGTNGREIEITSDGDPEGLSWLSNSRLLLSDPWNSTYFLDLPATLATNWATAGREPDLEAGKMATHGWASDSTYSLFLWTSNGPPTAPTHRCSYNGASGGSDAAFRSPSWAPDGGALVWEESDGVFDEAGEGIWIMPVGDLAAGCPGDSVIQPMILGASQPDWGPAAITTTPCLTVANTRVTEGDTGTVTANFVVSLSAASSQPVSVNYTTANGTAKAPADYTATSGTLTFDPGQTSRTVGVAVIGDTLYELAERFSLKVTGPTGATICDGVGLATIANNDPKPTLTVTDVSSTEGDSGTTTFTFTVRQSKVTGAKTAVTYATADGTATAASDYVAKTGTVSIPAGATTVTITVSVNGDLAGEPNETFFVSLTRPRNATLADTQAVGTITNDD